MQFLKSLNLGGIRFEFRKNFVKGNFPQVRVLRKNIKREIMKEVFRIEIRNKKPVLMGEDWLLQKEDGKRYTLFFIDKAPPDVAIENTMRFVLAQEAPGNGGILVHSSSAYFEGNGVCFIGKSGAGKTTILKLLKSFQPLNDDLNLLFFSKEKLFIFPLPVLSKNIFYPAVPVRFIFILNKSRRDELKKIKKEDALTEMLSCLPFLHFSPFTLKTGIKVLEKILDCISVYRLNFSLNGKAEEKIFGLIRQEIEI